MIYLLIRSAVQSGIPLLLYPMMLAFFGADIFSELIHSLYLATLISILIQFGFNLSGYRDAAAFSRDNTLDCFILKSLLIRMTLSTAVLIIIYFVDYLEVYAITFAQFVVISIICFSMAIENNWYLEWRQKFKALASVSVISIVIIFTFFALIKINGDPQKNMALYGAIVISLPYVLSAVGSVALSKISLRAIKSSICTTRQIRFVSQIKMVGVNIINSMYYTLGVIVMGSVVSSNDLARYVLVEKVAFGIIGVLSLFLTRRVYNMSILVEKKELFEFEIGSLFKKSLMVSVVAAFSFLLLFFIFRRYINSLLLPDVKTAALAAAFICVGVSIQFNNIACTLLGKGTILIGQNIAIVLFLIVFGTASVYLIGASGWLIFLTASNLIAMVLFFRNIRNT
jgi:hypothetical protein